MGTIFRFGRQRRRRYRAPRRRYRPLRSWSVAALLIGAAVAANAALYDSPESERGSAHFALCKAGWQDTCVVDGDTIRYRGEKIRLADIDAPEIRSPQCTSEFALGQRATWRLVDLMNAGPFEVARQGHRDTDRYGRKLRVVSRDGRSLGHQLVDEGLARRWDGARRGWC